MSYHDTINQYTKIRESTQSKYKAMEHLFLKCKNLLKKAKEYNSNKHYLQRTQNILEIMEELKKTSHFSLFTQELNIIEGINNINTSLYQMTYDLVIAGSPSSEYDAVIECFDNAEKFFMESEELSNKKSARSKKEEDSKNNKSRLEFTGIEQEL